jgi:hypothetical protein
MAARSTLTVVSGNTITSAWGNSVRDHVVTYTGSNDVTTEGQLAVNTTNDDVVIHNGSAAEIIGHYGGWYTSWTPTCTQGFAVALTVNRARWLRIFGRTIVFQANGSFAGNGSTNNTITFSLPVTAASSGYTIPGSGLIYDGSNNRPGSPYLASTTTVGLLPQEAPSTALLGASVMTAAVIAGNLWSISGVYEAAS